MKSIRLVSLGLAALLAAGALGGCKGSGDSDVKSPYDFEKYDPVVELTTDRYITSEDGLSAWEDDPYIRWAEVNLGIRWKPKFVVASKQEHDQKLVLLAATDDLPDAPQEQQQEQVTVSVATYKDKAPLAGALVKVSGSSKGAVTNSAGLAELRVPANSALEISYIGCKPHIAQVGDKERQMFMFDMQAETAGTPETPGTSESLATATAMDKPLYIVNGIETKEIGKLDPDRIESMSVLKDKAATALYGEKARNGVIVITLKGADMGPATSESNGKADDAEQTAANAIAIKNGKTEKEEAFLVTETMPLFPTDDPVVPYGDLGNFRAWVQKNVKYPAEAFEKGIGGRVVLSFVVEKDGSVSDIQKLQAPDASLWEEARRVIASSPKWKPGEQRGQIVRVKYTLPVDFRLTKASDTPAPESGK